MENTKSSSPNATEDFTFSYCSRGGPELGTSIQERDSCLVLKWRDQLAFLEKHRSESDAEEEPIGRFQMKLEPSYLNKIHDLLGLVRFSTLTPGTHGGPGVSTLELTFRSSEGTITKSISSRDIDLIQRLNPLFFELDKITMEVEKSPLSAIRVSIKYIDEPKNEHFVLTIINIGIETLYIKDPRRLRDIDTNWAGVQISPYPEEIPGFTAPPLKWARLYLVPLVNGISNISEIKLNPGQEVSFPTETWRPHNKNIRYLVQGVMSNYQGPATLQGIYRIRGAGFSQGIEITPN